jgi:hypothetical protein
VKQFLTVKNTMDVPNCYEVRTDIPCGSGEKTFSIQPESVHEYELTLDFKRSGTFYWNVYFMSTTDGSYTWFTIEVQSFSLFLF